MRVLVDAQLPYRLTRFLAAHKVDAIHTLDLPNKNATTDTEIIDFANSEDRVIISKDSDFLDNFILEGRPEKLLIVSTGNIGNEELIQIFESNVERLIHLFEESQVVEINEEEIQVHY